MLTSSALALTTLLFTAQITLSHSSRTFTSPDQKTEATVHVTDEGACLLDVKYHGHDVLVNAPLGLTTSRGRILGPSTSIPNPTNRRENSTWKPLWGKRSTVINNYEETTFECRTGDLPPFSLIVRVYDDGIAYRYVLDKKWGEFEINSEQTAFSFPNDVKVWSTNSGGFKSSQESEFHPSKISELDPAKIYGCPLLVKVAPDVWAAISEANLTDWAGMHFQRDAKNPHAVVAMLAPHPDEPIIAVRSTAPRMSPWRVLMLGNRPGDLIESDLIRNLNEPPEGDFSWVTPGKSTWDRWWSGAYAPELDFPLAMNNKSMEYFVDLAAELSCKYQLVDWEWYGEPFAERKTWAVNPKADITKSIPEIDIPALVAYAKERGVGIILWMHWESVDKQMNEAFPLYEKWGVKGVKIDFMDRDDQEMVNFYHRVAKKAAEHHLLVDFHGAYKPTGDSRTWPNLITREGVLGNEYNKWSSRVTPEHSVTIPFTRGLFGEMDFTPGGFRNKTEATFRPSDIGPFVMGTRAHQLAMFVVYESGLQVICDSPYNYRSSPAGVDFLKIVPTTWDDTHVIHGEVGDYITVARRSGNDWFVASMTDGTARSLDIPLEFLSDGKFRATIWADVYEADEYPDRLMKSELDVTNQDKLTAAMAPGGGHLIHLVPAK
jgi:alpha-glucosidase